MYLRGRAEAGANEVLDGEGAAGWREGVDLGVPETGADLFDGGVSGGGRDEDCFAEGAVDFFDVVEAGVEDDGGSVRVPDDGAEIVVEAEDFCDKGAAGVCGVGRGDKGRVA